MASRTYTQPFPAHSKHMLEQLNVQRYLGAFTDIVVRIGDVDFKLHRCLLAAACTRFQSLLCNMREECGNVLVLKTITPTGFRSVTEFIYTGIIKLDPEVAQDVLTAAQFLEMRDLEKAVLNYFKSVSSEAPMPPTEAALSLMRMSQGIGLSNSGTENTNVYSTTHEQAFSKSPASTDNQSGSGNNDNQRSSFPSISLPNAWPHPSQGPASQFPHPSAFYPNVQNTEGYFEDYLRMIESFQAQNSQNDPHLNQQRQQYSSRSHLNNRAQGDVEKSLASNKPDIKASVAATVSTTSSSEVGAINNPVSSQENNVLPNSSNDASNNFQDNLLSSSEDEEDVDDDIEDEEDDDGDVLCDLEESNSGNLLNESGEAIVTENQTKTEISDVAPVPATAVIKEEIQGNEDDPAICARSSTAREIACQTVIASFITRMKKKEDDRRFAIGHPRKCKKMTAISSEPKSSAKRKRGRPRKRPPTPTYSDTSDDETFDLIDDEFVSLGGAELLEDSESDTDYLPSFEPPPSSSVLEIKHRPLKKRLKEDKTDRIREKRRVGRKKKLKKLHECDKCGRRFGKHEALRKHMDMHDTLSVMFTCHICAQKFARPTELTQHMRSHSAEVFICNDCDLRFKDPRLYKKHMIQYHHDAKPFTCDFPECGFRSNRPSNVEKHAVIHSGIKTYGCPNCGKCFAQPNGLQSHLKSCYQRRGYLCDFCGQKFNYLQSMKSHRLLHTGEKPHQCPDCGARFADQRNFKRHRRIHDNAYPYPCTFCDKRFRHSNSLKAHLNIHRKQDLQNLLPMGGMAESTSQSQSMPQNMQLLTGLNIQQDRLTLPQERLSIPQERMNIPQDRLSMTEDRLNLSQERTGLSHDRSVGLHQEHQERLSVLPQERLHLQHERLNLHQERLNQERLSLQQEDSNPHNPRQHQHEPISMVMPQSLPPSLAISMHNPMPSVSSLSHAMSVNSNMASLPNMSSLHMSNNHSMMGHAPLSPTGINLSHTGIQPHQSQMLSSLQMGAMSGGLHLPPSMLHLQTGPQGPYDTVKSSIYETMK